MALWLAIISALLSYFQCQFTDFQLQSTSMLIDGDAWSTYYDNDTNKIWLLTPRSCPSNVCNYDNNMKVITYDTDSDIFENETTITNTTPSMKGITSQYAVTIGDEIYFNGEGGDVDKYNVKTGETTNVFQQGIRDGCLVADDRFVFFVGGMDLIESYGYTAFAVYDTVTEQLDWQDNMLWYPRYMSCELVNGTIYTFGGDDGNRDSRITKFDIGTGDDVLHNFNNNEWTQIGNLNIERAHHNSVRCDNVDSNLIYIIGGVNATRGVSDDQPLPELSIEIFNIETETAESAPFRLNEGRVNPAVVCVDKYIYIFGGRPYYNGATTASWEKSNELYSSSPTTFPTIEPSVSTIAPSYNPSIYPIQSPSKYPSTSPSKYPSTSPSDDVTSSYNPSISPEQQTIDETTNITSSETIDTLSTTTRSAYNSISTSSTTAHDTLDIITIILVTAVMVLICICIFVVIYIIHYLRAEKQKEIHSVNDMMTKEASKANDDADNNKLNEAMDPNIIEEQRTNGNMEDDDDMENERGEGVDINRDEIATVEGEAMNEMILHDTIGADEFIIQGDDETTQ